MCLRLTRFACEANVWRMSLADSQESDWLTVAEAARRLGVSIETIRRYDKRGVLKTFRTDGGHRRFRVADVEAFLNKASA